MNAAHSTRIERLFLDGPAGRLEALLEWVPHTPLRRAALVCHPHPLYGGTLHTKVVFRAAKAALSLGFPTLRFNFRGVGKSEGAYGHEIGERDDARAALDALAARFPSLPVVMMGFSFGSVVGLAVGAADARVSALVGMGVPVASSDLGFLRPVSKPKLIVQGTADLYGPRERLQEFLASLAEPKRIRWVEGADHFFTGRLDELQSAIREFLEAEVLA
ncbi:MAG TPA: alpha/beta fold hydrolase [Terriglobia bacterium]|nr:alpha/beta fold hydrolase [Terriglobia bacterium]